MKRRRPEGPVRERYGSQHGRGWPDGDGGAWQGEGCAGTAAPRDGDGVAASRRGSADSRVAEARAYLRWEGPRETWIRFGWICF